MVCWAQVTSDIPAHNCLKDCDAGDGGRTFDDGCRGVGGNAGCPTTSVGGPTGAVRGGGEEEGGGGGGGGRGRGRRRVCNAILVALLERSWQTLIELSKSQEKRT
jgi:hypothetical protein